MFYFLPLYTIPSVDKNTKGTRMARIERIFFEAEKIFQKINAKANQIDFSGLVLPVLRLKSVLIYPILVIRVPFFIVSGCV